MAEPNGPVDQAFFDRLMAQWESGLRDAGKIDGVYCVLHGAGLTTQDHDPEGTLLRLVRRLVGDAVPVVATYDLHANVSEDDVALLNAFIGYRTNPHLDMRDGITVVVLSNRYQCADPVFFEAFGLDIAAARVVVVKSRGHFRGGFDEFFRHQDIVEVDAPGLTSPILSRFAWRYMPRPVLPIDDDAPGPQPGRRPHEPRRRCPPRAWCSTARSSSATLTAWRMPWRATAWRCGRT